MDSIGIPAAIFYRTVGTEVDVNRVSRDDGLSANVWLEIDVGACRRSTSHGFVHNGWHISRSHDVLVFVCCNGIPGAARTGSVAGDENTVG